jgi:uncharacterized protein YndB with AHSA1/START domain
MAPAFAAPASTTVSAIIKASREAVYRACLDPDALVAWRVPDNMRGRMHAFEARQGGRFRMSLTYLGGGQSQTGKSSADTDTFEGRFLELVPGEKIVEVIEFESPDPRFAGEMKVITSLRDTGEGTEITMLFENIPAGVSAADNAEGSRQSLRKLAALFDRTPPRSCD